MVGGIILMIKMTSIMTVMTLHDDNDNIDDNFNDDE